MSAKPVVVIGVALLVFVVTLRMFGVGSASADRFEKEAVQDGALDAGRSDGLPLVTLRVGSGTTITAVFANPNERRMTLLKWGTPLEAPLMSDSFDVTEKATGRAVPYIGAMAKRGDPVAADFVEIAPHKSVSGQTNLADSYELTAGQVYSVRFSANLVVLPGGLPSALPTRSDLDQQPVRSEAVTVKAN